MVILLFIILYVLVASCYDNDILFYLDLLSKPCIIIIITLSSYLKGIPTEIKSISSKLLLDSQ